MLNISEKTINCSQMEHHHFSGTRELKSYGDIRICYVVSGSAQWQIDDRKHNISEGCIIFLHNRQKRYFTRLDDRDFKLAVITIRRQAFFSTAYLSCFFNMAREQNSVIKDNELLGILQKITDEYKTKQAGCFDMIAAELTEFFVITQRRYNLELDSAEKIDKSMLKVLDYIDMNFKERINLDDVSALANMAPTSFSRRFKEINGIGFKKYLMTRRIEYAVSLLENTELNSTDIAYECGFTSVSSFYDAFKKVTGTTPGKA